MLTKSKIQLVREKFESLNNFQDRLKELMEKFNIEDSIFVYKNNSVFEVTNGYFEIIKEYDNLADAMRECIIDLNNVGIRIKNNQTFIAGYIRKSLTECVEKSSVMDINSLSYIR